MLEAHDLQAELAARPVAARHESGLSQAEVAVHLGRPQSFVSKCETGERRADVVELARFADLYEHSLDWFVDHEPTPLERVRDAGGECAQAARGVEYLRSLEQLGSPSPLPPSRVAPLGLKAIPRGVEVSRKRRVQKWLGALGYEPSRGDIKPRSTLVAWSTERSTGTTGWTVAATTAAPRTPATIAASAAATATRPLSGTAIARPT